MASSTVDSSSHFSRCGLLAQDGCENEAIKAANKTVNENRIKPGSFEQVWLELIYPNSTGLFHSLPIMNLSGNVFSFKSTLEHQ